VPSYLVENETVIDEAWLDGAETVGLTSGASAPETLVARVLAWLRERGDPMVEERSDTSEQVHFAPPPPLR
jgi:4-hydroxy-3-methylbut-2-enyl diphosphate reductase